MPATEQTWRDTKTLHVVFGFSVIVMFVATLWLLIADHNREFKKDQRKAHQMEIWLADARNREYDRQAHRDREKELELASSQADETVPPSNLMADFVGKMREMPLDQTEETIELIQADYLDLKDRAEKKNDDDDRDLAPLRRNLLDEMQGFISSVKFIEVNNARTRKFKLADYDAMKSDYDLGVRDGFDDQKLAEIKAKVDAIQAEVQQLTLDLQSTATLRKDLEEILGLITHDKDAAEKLLSDHRATRNQLEKALKKTAGFWERLGHTALQMPILDAFGTPIKINQIWLPDLPLNNNFRDVARFDRCTSCHVSIDKTAPGSAIEPGFAPLQPLRVAQLATPAERPEPLQETTAERPDPTEGLTTQSLYGFELAQEGLIDANDIAIGYVWPMGPAAEAGLQRGDAIKQILVGQRWEDITTRQEAERYFLEQVQWGKPISVRYQRGVPNPYSSHPRLDLFVGSLSPHQLQDFGCTICHEGQGSATDFKWANHTPNTPSEAADWARKYRWFDNHHWIYPMQPSRFVESSCLKCHHEIEQLLPSDRFPEPPAPTLVHGHNLIKKYGCYGCHEIIGYDGPTRIGPDMRNEPAYAAAAQQLEFLNRNRVAQLPAAELKSKLTDALELANKVSWQPEDPIKRRALFDFVKTDDDRSEAITKILSDPGIAGDARNIAETIKTSPNDMEARAELVEWLNEDRRKALPQARTTSHNLAHLLVEPPLLSGAAHGLAAALKDVEHPGTLRRVGPSLRYVASKLGTQTLAKWIGNPQSIRATSKMPRFFNLHDHLKDSPQPLSKSQAYEPVEIRAITHYLTDRSQPFPYAKVASEVTEPPDATRGKEQFETRGCLACHHFHANPGSQSNHGPNLTDLQEKLRMRTTGRDAKSSKKWLYSWLIAPDRYHRRTVMPNTFLTPLALTGKDGKPDDKRITDPAADIVEYLLGSDWKGDEDALDPLDDGQRSTLREIALELLKTTFPSAKAKAYLENGIPEDKAATLKGAEIELLKPISNDKLLSYVGRRTLGRYGCAGCHDIPGFESEKPIGTTLADWGRKETSKLAFEHILHYVEKSHAGESPSNGSHAAEHGEQGDHDHQIAAGEHKESEHAGSGHESHHLDPLRMKNETEGHFVASLQHHQRAGFLWQKLNEPRSYDFKKAENKPYHDRLRMPQFPWGVEAAHATQHDGQDAAAAVDAAREKDIQAIMTFVLGLVAEPPPSKYVYQPDARRQAIVEGEAVLKKFNCAGCHVLQLDRWDIAFQIADDQPLTAFSSDDITPPDTKIYPFLEPHFTPSEIDQSKTPDREGRYLATLEGMSRIGKDGNPEPMAWDPEEDGFLTLEEFRDEYETEPAVRGENVVLWNATLIDGRVFLPKDPLPTIPETMIRNYAPARGGDFARLLIPIALDLVRKTDPSDIPGVDAWAWVPPPLVGQGHKTQEGWLTEFLLQPYGIRPGVLLRMPKFNMTRKEAAQLTQYFSAVSDPEYPSRFVSGTNASELAAAGKEYQQKLERLGLPESTRLDDALKIVMNKAGCVQCHSLGNLATDQAPRAAGPNLGDIDQRLQPSYIKDWVAKPSFTLPYTKMQELIPYPKGFQLTVLGDDNKPVPGPDGEPQTIDVYHGPATEQLQAIVDLLANFGIYVQSRTQIGDLVDRDERPADVGPADQRPADEGPADDAPADETSSIQQKRLESKNPASDLEQSKTRIGSLE